jgi:CheY-like chemotaxis protein
LRPEFGEVVIVAMTGWGQEEDRRRSKQAGFNYHLVKPVDPTALQALLASLANQQSRAAQVRQQAVNG